MSKYLNQDWFFTFTGPNILEASGIREIRQDIIEVAAERMPEELLRVIDRRPELEEVISKTDSVRALLAEERNRRAAVETRQKIAEYLTSVRALQQAGDLQGALAVLGAVFELDAQNPEAISLRVTIDERLAEIYRKYTEVSVLLEGLISNRMELRKLQSRKRAITQNIKKEKQAKHVNKAKIADLNKELVDVEARIDLLIGEEEAMWRALGVYLENEPIYFFAFLVEVTKDDFRERISDEALEVLAEAFSRLNITDTDEELHLAALVSVVYLVLPGIDISKVMSIYLQKEKEYLTGVGLKERVNLAAFVGLMVMLYYQDKNGRNGVLFNNLLSILRSFISASYLNVRAVLEVALEQDVELAMELFHWMLIEEVDFLFLALTATDTEEASETDFIIDGVFLADYLLMHTMYLTVIKPDPKRLKKLLEIDPLNTLIERAVAKAVNLTAKRLDFFPGFPNVEKFFKRFFYPGTASEVELINGVNERLNSFSQGDALQEVLEIEFLVRFLSDEDVGIFSDTRKRLKSRANILITSVKESVSPVVMPRSGLQRADTVIAEKVKKFIGVDGLLNEQAMAGLLEAVIYFSEDVLMSVFSNVVLPFATKGRFDFGGRTYNVDPGQIDKALEVAVSSLTRVYLKQGHAQHEMLRPIFRRNIRKIYELSSDAKKDIIRVSIEAEGADTYEVLEAKERTITFHAQLPRKLVLINLAKDKYSPEEDVFNLARQAWGGVEEGDVVVGNTARSRLADGDDSQSIRDAHSSQGFPRDFVLAYCGNNERFADIFKALIREAGFNHFETSDIGEQRFEVHYTLGLESPLIIFANFISRISRVFAVDEELAVGIIQGSLRHERKHLEDSKLLVQIRAEIGNREGKTTKEKDRLFKLIAEQLANQARGALLDIARDIWFRDIYSNPDYDYVVLRQNKRKMQQLINAALRRYYLQIDNPQDKKKIVRLVLEIDNESGFKLLPQAMGNRNDDLLEDGRVALALPEPLLTEEVLMEAEAIILAAMRIQQEKETEGLTQERVWLEAKGQNRISELEYSLLTRVLAYHTDMPHIEDIAKQEKIITDSKQLIMFLDLLQLKGFIDRDGLDNVCINKTLPVLKVIDAEDLPGKIKKAWFAQLNNVVIRGYPLRDEGRIDIGRKRWLHLGGDKYNGELVDLLVIGGMVIYISFHNTSYDNVRMLFVYDHNKRTFDAYSRIAAHIFTAFEDITILSAERDKRGNVTIGSEGRSRSTRFPGCEASLDIEKGVVVKARTIKDGIIIEEQVYSLIYEEESGKLRDSFIKRSPKKLGSGAGVVVIDRKGVRTNSENDVRVSWASRRAFAEDAQARLEARGVPTAVASLAVAVFRAKSFKAKDGQRRRSLRFAENGYFREENIRVIFSTKYPLTLKVEAMDQFINTVFENYVALRDDNQRYTEYEIGKILGQGFSYQAVKGLELKYGLPKSTIVFGMSRINPESFLKKMYNPTPVLTEALMQAGCCEQVAKGVVYSLAGVKAKIEIKKIRLKRFLASGLLSKEQAMFLKRIGKVSMDTFVNGFGPQEFACRIMAELDRFADIGFSEQKAGELVKRGYALAQFRHFMGSYNLSTSETFVLLKNYDHPEHVAPEFKRKMLEEDHRRERQKIKNTTLDIRAITEEFGISEEMVRWTIARRRDAIAALDDVRSFAEENGLSMVIAYRLRVQYGMSAEDINIRLAELADIYRGLEEESKNNFLSFNQEINSLREGLVSACSYEGRQVYQQSRSTLSLEVIGSRFNIYNLQVGRIFSQWYGYTYIQQIVIESFEREAKDGVVNSKYIFFGYAGRVREAGESIVRSRAVIMAHKRSAIDAWMGFIKHERKVEQEQFAGFINQANLSIRHVLGFELRTAEVIAILQEKDLELLISKLVNRFFNPHHRYRTKFIRRMLRNGLLTQAQAEMLICQDIIEFERRFEPLIFAERIKDNIVMLSQRIKFAGLLRQAVESGYGWQSVDDLLRQYPQMTRLDLALIFMAADPELYILSNFGLLDSYVQKAQMVVEEGSQLSEGQLFALIIYGQNHKGDSCAAEFNKRALSIITDRHRPMIQELARKYCPAEELFEDFLSEAQIALLDAATSYVPSYNDKAGFPDYARGIIGARLLEHRREENTRYYGSISLSTPVSYEEGSAILGDFIADPRADVYAEFEERLGEVAIEDEGLIFALKSLSLLEQKIVKAMVISDIPIYVVAEALGIGEDEVDENRQGAFLKLRNILAQKEDKNPMMGDVLKGDTLVVSDSSNRQIGSSSNNGSHHFWRPLTQYIAGGSFKLWGWIRGDNNLKSIADKAYLYPARQTYNANLAYIQEIHGNRGPPTLRDKIRALIMPIARGLTPDGSINWLIPLKLIQKYFSSATVSSIQIHESQPSELRGLIAQYRAQNISVELDSLQLTGSPVSFIDFSQTNEEVFFDKKAGKERKLIRTVRLARPEDIPEIMEVDSAQWAPLSFSRIQVEKIISNYPRQLVQEAWEEKDGERVYLGIKGYMFATLIYTGGDFVEIPNTMRSLTQDFTLEELSEKDLNRFDTKVCFRISTVDGGNGGDIIKAQKVLTQAEGLTNLITYSRLNNFRHFREKFSRLLGGILPMQYIYASVPKIIEGKRISFEQKDTCFEDLGEYFAYLKINESSKVTFEKYLEASGRRPYDETIDFHIRRGARLGYLIENAYLEDENSSEGNVAIMVYRGMNLPREDRPSAASITVYGGLPIHLLFLWLVSLGKRIFISVQKTAAVHNFLTLEQVKKIIFGKMTEGKLTMLSPISGGSGESEDGDTLSAFLPDVNCLMDNADRLIYEFIAYAWAIIFNLQKMGEATLRRYLEYLEIIYTDLQEEVEGAAIPYKALLDRWKSLPNNPVDYALLQNALHSIDDSTYIDIYYRSGIASGELTLSKDVGRYGAFGASDTFTILDISRLLLNKMGMRVLDLGSGNGKTVVLFSKQASQATGIEIDRQLFLEGRYSVDALAAAGRVDNSKITLLQGDFLRGDFSLSEYDLIYIYWPFDDSAKKTIEEETRDKLQAKLLKEMKPGAYFIVCVADAQSPELFPRLSRIYFNEEQLSSHVRVYQRCEAAVLSIGWVINPQDCITVLNNTLLPPAMVRLPVVRVDSLTDSMKQVLAMSLQRWLDYSGEVSVAHSQDITMFISFLKGEQGYSDDVRQALSSGEAQLYYALSYCDLQFGIGGWVYLNTSQHSRESTAVLRKAFMEIAPWNRGANPLFRRYNGVGMQLRSVGIKKLLGRVVDEQYDPFIFHCIEMLGLRDATVKNIFDDGVDPDYVERYLQRAEDTKQEHILWYGIPDGCICRLPLRALKDDGSLFLESNAGKREPSPLFPEEKGLNFIRQDVEGASLWQGMIMSVCTKLNVLPRPTGASSLKKLL
ncbi:MAG: sigma factor, partial [Candidatus Omnitrophota bacterium]|nr:sigma factor [Candidatus Omnitrophota bacterium]